MSIMLSFCYIFALSFFLVKYLLIMKYKNNPANIRCGSRWLGLSGTLNGFCEFKSPEFGIRALLYILHKYYYVYRLQSISSIIGRFAPPSENDTKRYIDYVTNQFDIFHTLGDFPDIVYISKAICYYESHSNYTFSYINEVYCKYIHQFPKYNEKEKPNQGT